MTGVAVLERVSKQDFFPRAAEIVAFRVQGAPFAKFPLLMDVLFGEEMIVDDAGFGFEVKFRRCSLILTLQRCEIASQSGRYRKTLEQEEFSHFIERLITSNVGIDAHAGVSSDGVLTNILSSIGINVSAGASITSTLKDVKDKKYTSKIGYRIVDPRPANAWQIGHQHIGDPRSIDQALAGQYFHEPADGQGSIDDYANAVCTLQPLGVSRTFVISAELRARHQDCVYSTVQNDKPGTFDYVKNKERIEKIVLLKSIQKQQQEAGLAVMPGEFVLSRSVIKVRIED